ncbi:hypothetical protein PROFUN_04596 [Planoprotostelium fungivorum]|uniref:Uncharacterized protein n=1 Tax=Planoprotostelium fungivorum TaxID=1890364 RepID=A0A2P6NUC8_9EUKA|nr:hypothetical protein PROFUN_04596 [Planoprotostelium fungivorum]
MERMFPPDRRDMQMRSPNINSPELEEAFQHANLLQQALPSIVNTHSPSIGGHNGNYHNGTKSANTAHTRVKVQLNISVRPCGRCKSKGIECVERVSFNNKRRRDEHVHSPASDPILQLGEEMDNLFSLLTPNNPFIQNQFRQNTNNMMEGTNFNPDKEVEVREPPSLCLFNAAYFRNVSKPQSETVKKWYTEKAERLRTWLTPQQKENMVQEYDRQLSALKTGSDESEYPELICGFGGYILHANGAFLADTRYIQSNQEMNVNHFLSPCTLSKVRQKVSIAIMTSIKRLTLADACVKCMNTPYYLIGVLCITIKRDVFDIPHLFHIHFAAIGTVPDEVILNEECKGQGLDDIRGQPINEEQLLTADMHSYEPYSSSSDNG